jgi:uncharacterized iron-regulated membrane protein
MSTTSTDPQSSSAGLDYRTVWRWHFYAGLFCIPFVLWLATTGSIFLFKPQIIHWLDRPYSHLAVDAQHPSINAQVQAALAAVPGSSLHSYQLPRTADAAPQILVGKGTQEYRVYVHPQTLQILKIQNEDKRPMDVIQHLHGELLIGATGSMIVELAASWAVVMIVTGLFLWWPRSSDGLAGVLYPRLRQGQRTFWRDIHAVTGIWISFFALFLLFTGLPWAKSWGGYLKAVRHLSGERVVKQDWNTSSSAVKAARLAMNHADADAASSAHAEHMHHAMTMPAGPDAYRAIDTMVAVVTPMHLPEPVLITPPTHAGGNWTARTDTQNRPQRVTLTLDAQTGQVVQRQTFSQRPWLDRVVFTGVAAHEGQLFGVLNQIISLMTALGLELLCVSALVMWWRRRPDGVLGAPAPIHRVRFSFGLIAFLVIFGLYMPFLGASMILVGLTERFVLRRIPAAQRWLGLSMPERALA